MTLLIPTLGFLQPGACSKLEQSFKKIHIPYREKGVGKEDRAPASTVIDLLC